MRRSLLFASALVCHFVWLNPGRPACASELPTPWQIPPGDPLEHTAAGFAKVLCSARFISGRDLAAAIEEDGFFVAPRAERRLLKPTVDAENQTVRVTLPNGITRTAKRVGDQGCVTLPRGAEAPFFTPLAVTSSLPDPRTQPWPMGDKIARADRPRHRSLAAQRGRDRGLRTCPGLNRGLCRGPQGTPCCRALSNGT
jgi:hypothetical protein